MSIAGENLPLPKDQMPDAWFDDNRMNSMFAEFRNRSVNSQDWDSKFKFWESLINNYLNYNKQCIFSYSELSSVFKRKGRTPLCLPTVIDKLNEKGEIISLQSFQENYNSSWLFWAVNKIVIKPVTWSFSKLNNFMPITSTQTNINTKYIHITTIKELSNLIISLANNEKDLILSVAQITKKCSEKIGKNLTEENIKLALFWLGKSKKDNLSFENSCDECLLKISSNGIENLSEADKGLFKLKESERILLEKIENLEIERNTILVKAKSSLNNGLKEVAKTYLRRKKELDGRIEKHAATLQNLHTLISSIHDAHSNSEVLEAYKKGRDILKGFGINEFSVRDTVDDMIEAVGEVHDIQSTLSENIKGNDSDIDLEKELDELMNSNSKDTSFPNIPNSELPELEKELHALLLEDVPAPPTTFSNTSSGSSKKVPIL